MAELRNVPVALLIFNRPDTTARVFEQIKLARPANLFIIADGPRPGNETDETACQAARQIATQFDWPCDLHTNFSETNMGLQRRIPSGLDWVFQHTDEAIILEDDCVPHQDFFPFCQQMLARYRHDERIMLITGSNMVPDLPIPESYLFSRWYHIWGWATWKRAWDLYDASMTDWPMLRKAKLVESLYPIRYVHRYLRKSFDLAHSGRMSTWGIRWFYTCLRSSGLCITPGVNLITNIGVAGTHTQTGHNALFPTAPLDAENLRHPAWVYPHPEYDPAFFAARLKPTARSTYANVRAAGRVRAKRLLHLLRSRLAT